MYLLSPAWASAPKIEEPDLDRLIIRQNFLVAMASPVFIKPVTYGSLIERIISCESGGDPKVCNKQYGCYAGMGLFQLIPSTVKYCEEKMDKRIDPFNKQDNTECAMWLLENEGTRHWDQSKSCWGI